MMKYNSWDIVLIKFPFTDLSNYKLRPALVISNKSYNKHDNLMLIWIYGNKWLNQYSSKISQEDLKHWKLKKDSYFRLHNIFSLHKSLIVSKVAELENKKIKKLKNKLCDFMD